MNHLEKSELLHDNKWVQLYSYKGFYTFSHEKRCSGNIVVVLPYKFVDNKLMVLSRVEATPCWEESIPVKSSLTGGVDIGSTPEATAINELREEAGFIIDESKLVSLGTTYSTKSCDSIYHIFAVHITDDIVSVEPTDYGHEKNDLCEWLRSSEIINLKDPFLFVAVGKLKQKLNSTKKCFNCMYVKILDDPDPIDSFNYDDRAMVCSAEKPLPNQFKAQSGVPFRYALISSALRPYEISKVFRPNWCPLNDLI